MVASETLFQSVLVRNPIEVAHRIQDLELSGNSLSKEVEVPGLDDLVKIAHGLEEVNPLRARNFFQKIGDLEVAIATDDSRKLLLAQKTLASTIHGMGEKEWREVLAVIRSRDLSLAQKGGIHARWDRTVLPHMREVFSKEPLQVELNTEKPTQTALRKGRGFNGEYIHIFEDPTWQRSDETFGGELVHVEVEKYGQFIIQENLDKTSLQWIGRQTEILNSIMVDPGAASFLPGTLPLVLKDATSKPEIKNQESRFIMRSAYTLIPLGSGSIDEAYWIVTWTIAPGQQMPDLYVLMQGQEQSSGSIEDIWIPFKTFVKEYVSSRQHAGLSGMYTFSRFDIEEYL